MPKQSSGLLMGLQVVNLIFSVAVLSVLLNPREVAHAAPEPAPPTPTITASASPSPTPTPTPRPARVVGGLERAYLARLCVVEVRSMGERREDACLSVIGTVLARMDAGLMSDGTIKGTITWGCTHESEWCQFPSYSVDGCEGIVWRICPYAYPEAIDHFLAVVDTYFDDGQRGSCDGYLYYWLRASQDCRIEAKSGVFTNWFKKADK